MPKGQDIAQLCNPLRMLKSTYLGCIDDLPIDWESWKLTAQHRIPSFLPYIQYVRTYLGSTSRQTTVFVNIDQPDSPKPAPSNGIALWLCNHVM
jgi:hypothetical protein